MQLSGCFVPGSRLTLGAWEGGGSSLRVIHTLPPPLRRASFLQPFQPQANRQGQRSSLQCHMGNFICILSNFPVQPSHSDDCTISILCSQSGSHPRSTLPASEMSVLGAKKASRRRCCPARGLRDWTLQRLAGWRCGFCEGKASLSTGLPSPSPPSFLGT